MPDGRARVQALPKGNAGNSDVLRKFATSVMAAEPSATGPAISLYQSGKTVIRAFIEAGTLALVAIAVLLLIALRRLTDVLLTLIPLLLAGAVTLEICVLTGTAINFANIIALPLLLGVGVAFKIYYIMAWRDGKDGVAAIQPDPGGDLQRHDQCGRVWKHVVIELSGHVEHGEDDGARAALHDGGRRAVSAGLDGAAATGQSGFGAVDGSRARRRGIGLLRFF